MEKKTLREKVRELDEMTRSVTPEEADLLNLVLAKLKKGARVVRDETLAIDAMYLAYFPEGDEEHEADEDLEDDGVDEGDFV